MILRIRTSQHCIHQVTYPQGDFLHISDIRALEILPCDVICTLVVNITVVQYHSM